MPETVALTDGAPASEARSEKTAGAIEDVVASTGLGRARFLFLSAGLAGLILIHAWENWKDKEHWPFCSYPMYSWLERERSVSAHRLAGILPDGSEVKIQKNEYTYPFDQARFSDSLWLIHKEPDAHAREVDLLRDMFRRYEARRRAGDHSGPAIVGLRLYRTKHRLKPWAENLDHPEERVLFAEYRLSR